MNFANLTLAEPLLRAIEDAGYDKPTPIQQETIPLILEAHDLLAAAQTGTGKTASFTLPLLQQLYSNPKTHGAGQPRSLILTPTRELAAQVSDAVGKYGKYTELRSMVIFGGVNINSQIEQLKQPIDILIATPGRLLDHIKQQTLDLSQVETLVLDEADRMLDMGFIRDIKKIMAQLPATRQSLLYSATFSDEIKRLAEELLQNPRQIQINPLNSTAELIEQGVYPVAKHHKSHLLSHLIETRNWQQVLVFIRTKHGANRLVEKLAKKNIGAAAIHGNKSQSARTRALTDFKAGELRVLVATDIAARGLDIDMLPHVVNYDLPNAPEDYVHRIGRTGRAGCNGQAISLITEEEQAQLDKIEKLINLPIPRLVADDFVAPDIPMPQAQAQAQAQAQPQSSSPKPAAKQPTRPKQKRPNKVASKKPAVEQPSQGNDSDPQTQANKQAKRKKPKKRQLSEAARHQAMPQPPLFSPEKPARNRNNNSGGGSHLGYNHNRNHREY